MENIFIKKIHINQVRHIQNFEIPISETERKHLILTGKNGSGKTSVLEAINESFKYLGKKRRISLDLIFSLEQKDITNISSYA